MHSLEDSDIEKDGFRLICLRVTSASASEQRGCPAALGGDLTVTIGVMSFEMCQLNTHTGQCSAGLVWRIRSIMFVFPLANLITGQKESVVFTHVEKCLTGRKSIPECLMIDLAFLPFHCLVNGTCISQPRLPLLKCVTAQRSRRWVGTSASAHTLTSAINSQPQTSSMRRQLVRCTFNPLCFSTPSTEKPHCMNHKVISYSSTQPIVHPSAQRVGSLSHQWRGQYDGFGVLNRLTPIWRKPRLYVYVLYFQTNINIVSLKVHLAKTLQSRGWREMTRQTVLCRYCSVFPFRKWFPLTPSGPAALIKVIWNIFFFFFFNCEIGFSKQQTGYLAKEMILETVQKNRKSNVCLLEQKMGIPCHFTPSLCQSKLSVKPLQCGRSHPRLCQSACICLSITDYSSQGRVLAKST